MARGSDADVALLEALEAIELAGVALQRFVVGRGLLDPSGAAAVTTFATHHDQHAVAYRTARSAEQAAVADPTVSERLGPAILAAVDGPTLAAAALAVEIALAATAVHAAGRFSSPTLAALAAGIAPVEAQHAAALATALGLPAAQATPEVILVEASVLDG